MELIDQFEAYLNKVMPTEAHAASPERKALLRELVADAINRAEMRSARAQADQLFEIEAARLARGAQ